MAEQIARFSGATVAGTVAGRHGSRSVHSPASTVVNWQASSTPPTSTTRYGLTSS
jgi:hypothetical protein